MPDLLTPKFLTKEVAREAVEAALCAAGRVPDIFSQGTRHHIVVLVPGMVDDRPDYASWPYYDIKPMCLYEASVTIDTDGPSAGDVRRDIVRCKALQLWHGRSDGGIQPHLLFSGDTPYWGGVRRHGLVVACCGYKPYYDAMICGIAVDAMVAMAQHAWLNSDDKKIGLDFLA